MPRTKRPRDPEPEPDDVRYGAAVAEIEEILASIDRDEIDVDELGQKVERAVELLKVCRAKLKATEARVTQVLEDLAADEAVSDADRDEPGAPPPADDENRRSAMDDAGAGDGRDPRRKSPPKGEPESDDDLPF